MDNRQYYPTPLSLAQKAWALFQQPVELLLEPSAGQGHLVKSHCPHFAEMTQEEIAEHHRQRRRWGYRTGHEIKWIACEINADFHPLLKEEGAEIVGYDFLDMKDASMVSHVLMNPPFNDGDTHVLHAWKILHAGEIVAIINAETIRNPFSVQRQKLVRLIEQHGHVEFLSGEFLGEDVVRETAVEVALVYLNKVPDVALNLDAILAGLKPAEDEIASQPAAQDAMNALALPTDFIDRVVGDYETAASALKAYAQALAVKNSARARLGKTFTQLQAEQGEARAAGGDRPTLSTHKDQASVMSMVRKAILEETQEMRAAAWTQVLNSTELLKKLSSAAQRDVQSQFETIRQLEFNRSNIHGFFAGLLASMDDIATNMVLAVFDMIIERDNANCVFYKSWKSNQRHKGVGMRIKRTRFVLPLNRGEYSADSYMSSGMQLALRDIDKTCRFLDGKSTEEGFGLYELFSRHFQRLVAGERLASDYIEARYYPGTGTVHFFPTNMEVIERMNRFVGRARQWLPPDMDQANDDFKTAYERAEKMQADYETEIKKTSASRNYRSVVYAMLKGNEEQAVSDVAELENAIQTVLTKEGLNPQAVLPTVKVVPQIATEVLSNEGNSAEMQDGPKHIPATAPTQVNESQMTLI